MTLTITETHIGSYLKYENAEALKNATRANVSTIKARRSLMNHQLSVSSDQTLSTALKNDIQMCNEAIHLCERKAETAAPPPPPQNSAATTAPPPPQNSALGYDLPEADYE